MAEQSKRSAKGEQTGFRENEEPTDEPRAIVGGGAEPAGEPCAGGLSAGSPHTDSSAPAPFEFSSRVRYSEVDSRQQLTLPALINYFQDCSTFQSEALGLGIAWLARCRRAWLLTHWQIVIDRYPSLCEPITVGTFPHRFRGVSAGRNFYVRDAAGKLIARADSTWAFVDTEAGRPTRPEPEQTDPYGMFEAIEMPPASRKIALPDEAELAACDPIPVLRHQIDTNGHVNNCEYVQMALELLAGESQPRQVCVDYKRAAVLGDVVYPRMMRDADRAVVRLDDGAGKPYAVVELRSTLDDEPSE